jgi:hypothetical protein
MMNSGRPQMISASARYRSTGFSGHQLILTVRVLTVRVLVLLACG